MSFLAPEAHTVAVDPATHLVYFPLQSGSNVDVEWADVDGRVDSGTHEDIPCQ